MAGIALRYTRWLACATFAFTAAAAWAAQEAGKVEIWWLGQSATRITTPTGKVILIPIGGHYVLSPKDAAFVTNTWLKPKFAIPIHYASNPYLKGTPKEYMDALGTTSTKVFPLKQGDKVTF